MKKLFLMFLFSSSVSATILFEKSIVEKIIFIDLKKMYKVTLKNQASDYFSKIENYQCLKKSLNGEEVKLEIDPINLQIIKCSIEKN